MEVITKGSVESILVPMRDRLNNIDDLANVTNLRFSTKRKSDGAPCQTNVSVTLDSDWPMTAICQIDTSLSPYVAGDEYHLYISHVAGSEIPVLGPVAFRVEAD